MTTLLYSCWFSVGHQTCTLTVMTSSSWLRRAMLAPDLRHDCDHILVLVPTSRVGHHTYIMTVITLSYSCWFSVRHQTCTMTVITLLYSCWFSFGHQTCIMTVITLLYSCWFSVGHQTCTTTMITASYWFLPAVLGVRHALCNKSCHNQPV